jgi:cytoskeletal protein RodZ
LRKYAQLVQVDEADLMLDYYQLTRSAAMPQVVSTRPKPRREVSPTPWLGAFIVFVIAAAAYWWFTSGSAAPVSPTAEGTAASPQEIAANSPIEMNATDTPDEALYIGQAEPETAPLVAAVEEPIEERTGAPLVAGLSMTLSFIGDCWTEITDANGRRLFFGLGTTGRRVNLSGEAPFNVLFGNAENVSVQVNGLPYDIPAAGRRGRTARLTISGS